MPAADNSTAADNPAGSREAVVEDRREGPTAGSREAVFADIRAGEPADIAEAAVAPTPAPAPCPPPILPRSLRLFWSLCSFSFGCLLIERRPAQPLSCPGFPT